MPTPTPTLTTSTVRFAAMGVDVLVGGATDSEAAAVRRLFERRARALGTHPADSELRWVNRSDAPAVAVSALLAETLADALLAAEETGGLADPTPDGRWREITLAGLVLRRPPGLVLDLDPIARARAVDDAVRLVAGPGFVAAGPDLATRTGAVVAVGGDATIHVPCGGLATAVAPPAGDDPAAGGLWRSVTVAAATCRDAGVAARAALGLGAAGPDWLDAHDLPGRFTGPAGPVANRHWRATTTSPSFAPPRRRPEPIDLPGDTRS